MRTLDRTDRLILDIMQKEGRIAISELAARINLSTTPCSERVKRLEREGVIMGYHARVNPALVEKSLLVFLEIKLSAKSGDVFDQVAKDLAQIPEVLECHLISGEFDYLVKARLKQMSAYRRLLGDILKKLPASASSHSYIVMEEVKESLYLEV
ncbi:winged helix-turn-helix transcriptional regulator [Acinetobacter qingfengensis]|uniref:Leucine-responsive regulatory protein n=1 Tax=Acinetobacter qingfengensis TaxID=1262585 RepID=A0A1E7RDS0_9GAMM|nr:Lrp/AsnC ligand binding domain-containing protein [Acinetobacter qingfengensis]KAA8735318.1 winged helix-turn-helix transcriptional regulator [Acinetobacter qingfengensis]OEY97436.1 AsnC family transcriptional regulator [Acinetobacter qingfengensis]